MRALAEQVERDYARRDRLGADQLAAIGAYAARIAKATPAPSPALAAHLRTLFNPADLPERLAVVDEIAAEAGP